MTTIETPSAEDDIAEVARLASEGKRVTDPELLRRIRERSDALRQEMLRSRLCLHREHRKVCCGNMEWEAV